MQVVSPALAQPAVVMAKQLALPAPPVSAQPQQEPVAPPAVQATLEPVQRDQADTPMAETVEEQLDVVAPTESKPAALQPIEDQPTEPEVKIEAPQVPNALENNSLLEDALAHRDAKKKGAKLMKKPAASKQVANTKPGPLEAKKSKAVPVSNKKPAKQGHNKGPIPNQKVRMRLKPQGCAKCRQRKGCCDSCWVQRGYRKG